MTARDHLGRLQLFDAALGNLLALRSGEGRGLRRIVENFKVGVLVLARDGRIAQQGDLGFFEIEVRRCVGAGQDLAGNRPIAHIPVLVRERRLGARGQIMNC